MNHYQKLVQDFHVKFGQPVGDYANPKPSRPKLRADLILEEGGETADALRKRDMVGVADGLCDMLYVTCGAAVEYGIELYEVDQLTLGPPRFHDWSLGIELDQCHHIEIAVHGAAVQLACDPENMDTRTRLNLLLDACFLTADQLGIKLLPLFDEVHRSNCTKTGGGTRADGKILKGPNFEPPRIRELLIEQGWVP